MSALPWQISQDQWMYGLIDSATDTLLMGLPSLQYNQLEGNLNRTVLLVYPVIGTVLFKNAYRPKPFTKSSDTDMSDESLAAFLCASYKDI